MSAAGEGLNPSTWKDRRAELAAVAIPGLLALGLCLIGLGARSLWLDEGASISIASQHGVALWRALRHDGGNMLGYYLLLHAWHALVGDSITLLRLPSAVCAGLTAGLLASLALRFGGRRAALAAGLLCAVSLPLVFWGQDIRGYGPMVMLLCASWRVLLSLRDRSVPVAWFAYVLCTLGAVLCGFPAALVVPAQALCLRRSDWRRPALPSAFAVIAAGCIPLVVLAAHRGSGQLFWVSPPGWEDLGQALAWLTSSAMPPNFPLGPVGVLVLVLSAVTVALPRAHRSTRAPAPAAAPAHAPAPAHPPAAASNPPPGGLPDRRLLLRVALAWLLIPPLLDLVESLAGQPALLSRNSLVSLPAMALLLGGCLTSPRIRRGLSPALLAALLALRLAVLVPDIGRSPEDWRAATSYLLHSTRAGDCVAFYPQDGWMAASVYVRASHHPAPTSILPAAGWRRPRPYVESYRTLTPSALVALPHRCPRLWLLSSHAGQATGAPVSRANRRRLLALVARLSGSYGPPRRRNFGYAARIDVRRFGR